MWPAWVEPVSRRLVSSEERAGQEIKKGKGEISAKRLQHKDQEDESYAAQETEERGGSGGGEGRGAGSGRVKY